LPSQQDAHERLIRNGAPLNVRPAAYLRLALGQEEGLFRPAFTSMVECYIRSQEGCSSAFEIEITELPPSRSSWPTGTIRRAQPCDRVEDRSRSSVLPSMSPRASATARVHRDSRRQEIVWAQVRLLYGNANLGAFVTILAATILGRFQWPVVPHVVVVAWWAYMVLVSASRYALARRFRQVSNECVDVNKWRVAYALCVGLAGMGWGGAGILLYPEAHLANQVSLVFVIGGIMLGASSLLAARPEAFVAFLCPAGLLPAGRFLAHGDETHITMGVLAGVFTVAVLITTTRIYGTVESSLELQFENRDLVQDLRRANEETEALNQALELRVQERTAELQQSTEQLRAEIAHREQIQGELLRVRNLESLGALAGGIAHDFNNFLTIVQGNTELVKEQLGAGDPIEAILDETARACRRAASLSAQLLTFAKGGAPVRRVVPVGNLIMDAVHLVRAGAPISVSVAIAEDLQCAPVDPAQMAQVLHSILLNARESMPDGGIIEVSAENAVREEDPDIAPRVRISIRDYGCGSRVISCTGYSIHTSARNRATAGLGWPPRMQSLPSTAATSRWIRSWATGRYLRSNCPPLTSVR
jgi:signal transduction histidine kinase